MRGLDLGRPDLMFLVVWAGTTWLAYEDLYYMTFDRSVPITLLIGCNIISFFVLYAIAAAIAPRTDTDRPDSYNRAALHRWNRRLFAGWIVLFACIVIQSGGIPAWWRFRNMDKSYVDFGVSTVSGFANMLRSFIFCLSVLLWLRQRNRGDAVIGMFVLASSVVEMARANTTYLLLCGMGVYLVNRRVRLKSFAVLAGLGVLFVLAFGLAEQYRTPGGSGGEKILDYPSTLNKYPYGVTSVYLYLTTPVSNLYYAQAHGIQPLYKPYFSLQLLVPTVIRERIYSPHEYPIALRRASHNATTFYAPLIADFGVLAAGFLVCLIQFGVAYVHVRAVRGNLFYQLSYGPLFAALALSFFFNYFLTLGVLLFPVLAFGILGSHRRDKASSGFAVDDLEPEQQPSAATVK
jgi:oligosaccharide repeat unit polymerase